MKLCLTVESEERFPFVFLWCRILDIISTIKKIKQECCSLNKKSSQLMEAICQSGSSGLFHFDFSTSFPFKNKFFSVWLRCKKLKRVFSFIFLMIKSWKSFQINIANAYNLSHPYCHTSKGSSFFQPNQSLLTWYIIHPWMTPSCLHIPILLPFFSLGINRQADICGYFHFKENLS